MKVNENQEAPAFAVEDIYGNPISIPEKGKKVLLSFMRFAGCPVCNLRVHALLNKADAIKAANIQVVLVYESSKELMLEYLANEKFPFVFIADRENKLYEEYSIEKSVWKVMKGMFNGVLSKAMSGKKLYSKSVKMDGPASRIEADFLLDEQGKVSIAHYGGYFGDELSIDRILAR